MPELVNCYSCIESEEVEYDGDIPWGWIMISVQDTPALTTHYFSCSAPCASRTLKRVTEKKSQT